MMNNVLAILYLFYGGMKASSLWKRRKKREAVVLGIASLIIVSYFIPVVGATMPTSESMNKFLYQTLSNYVVELLNIKLEVQKL